MTQAELHKTFDDLFLETGISLKDGRANLVDYYVKLINKHVNEVIGEDEDTNSEDLEITDQVEYANCVRADQRKRAGVK